MEHLYWLYFLFSADEILSIMSSDDRRSGWGDKWRWSGRVCVCVNEKSEVKHIHTTVRYKLNPHFLVLCYCWILISHHRDHTIVYSIDLAVEVHNNIMAVIMDSRPPLLLAMPPKMLPYKAPKCEYH